MVEIPDKPMLETQFTDNGGNLYKPKGSGATFSTYVEEDYDKETNEKEADFSDVRALYDALQADRGDAAVWRANLEKALNVDGFLRWLAVNTTIQSWDSYGLMAQNYYLYNDPADTQLHWIPFDNNMALSGGRSLPLELDRVSNDWPLIRYLMDDPVYHAIYVEYVGETIEKTFYPDRMRPIYKAAHEMIRPYVVGDEGEVSGYTLLRDKENFDKGLDYLNKHVQDRLEAAQKFINK
jgi:spore coat protein CotH